MFSLSLCHNKYFRYFMMCELLLLFPQFLVVQKASTQNYLQDL